MQFSESMSINKASEVHSTENKTFIGVMSKHRVWVFEKCQMALFDLGLGLGLGYFLGINAIF